MEVKISELERLIQHHPQLKKGCIVDTNIVFAFSFPLDTFNEWAEEVVSTLHKLNIPIYTNLNVRSEFIDLNRRVMIPEGLVDFYDEIDGSFDEGTVIAKLKSLKTRKRKAEDEGRTFKLSDSEIKQYSELLNSIPWVDGDSNWTLFCRDYFAPYIDDVWERAVKRMKINFLGTREIESKEFFEKHPSWENMIKIVGLSGLGSSDAMIVNLFQESKIPLMITADVAVKNMLVEFMAAGNFVLAP
jgi:hypothetical protein